MSEITREQTDSEWLLTKLFKDVGNLINGTRVMIIREGDEDRLRAIAALIVEKVRAKQ